MILSGGLLVNVDQSLANEKLEALPEGLLNELLGILKGIEVVSQFLDVSSQIMCAHVQPRELVDLSLVFF